MLHIPAGSSVRKHSLELSEADLGRHPRRFITPEARCRYDVCMPVPDEIEHDDEVDMQVLRGGSFAVYQTSFVRGGGLVAWERFAQGWLASSGYQIDFRPSYAAYLPKTRDDHGDDFSTEFCLAVKRPYEVTPQRRTCNFAKRGVTAYPDKRI